MLFSAYLILVCSPVLWNNRLTKWKLNLPLCLYWMFHSPEPLQDIICTIFNDIFYEISSGGLGRQKFRVGVFVNLAFYGPLKQQKPHRLCFYSFRYQSGLDWLELKPNQICFSCSEDVWLMCCAALLCSRCVFTRHLPSLVNLCESFACRLSWSLWWI